MLPFGMGREWFMAPTQRCLIPFTAFAEAEGAAGALTKTWIRVADQPLAAWAGLWRPTDEWGDCYTGVLVDATAERFDIHDRMPVILRTAQHAAWPQARISIGQGKSVKRWLICGYNINIKKKNK